MKMKRRKAVTVNSSIVVVVILPLQHPTELTIHPTHLTTSSLPIPFLIMMDEQLVSLVVVMRCRSKIKQI